MSSTIDGASLSPSIADFLEKTPLKHIHARISHQMRKDLEENEEAQAYMQALRGAGIRDYAEAEGEMRLLEIEEGEAEGAGGEADRLPQVYDPKALKDYFARRPQVRGFSALGGGVVLRDGG